MNDIPILGTGRALVPPGQAEMDELQQIAQRGDVDALVALHQRCDPWLASFLDALAKAGQVQAVVSIKTCITILLELQKANTAVTLAQKAVQDVQQAYAFGLEDARDLVTGAKQEVHREGFPHVKFGDFDNPDASMKAEAELREKGVTNVTIIPPAGTKTGAQ